MDMQNLRNKVLAMFLGGVAFLVPVGGCPGGPGPDSSSGTLYTPSTDGSSSETGSPTTSSTTETSMPADTTTTGNADMGDPRPDYDLPPPVPCCKFCGPDSKACGDSCIANVLNCHKPPGCACEGVLPQ